MSVLHSSGLISTGLDLFWRAPSAKITIICAADRFFASCFEWPWTSTTIFWNVQVAVFCQGLTLFRRILFISRTSPSRTSLEDFRLMKSILSIKLNPWWSTEVHMSTYYSVALCNRHRETFSEPALVTLLWATCVRPSHRWQSTLNSFYANKMVILVTVYFRR